MAKSVNGNPIDLALSVLCIIAARDETLSTYEIADVCGCSQTLISKNLRSGLQKLRNSKLKEFN
jgi:DNA-directed RNA polymerase specialized sigma24 family protein